MTSHQIRSQFLSLEVGGSFAVPELSVPAVREELRRMKEKDSSIAFAILPNCVGQIRCWRVPGTKGRARK